MQAGIAGRSRGPQIVADRWSAVPARSRASSRDSGGAPESRAPAEAHVWISRADLLNAGKMLALAQLVGALQPLRPAEALTQDENNVIRMFQRNKSSVVFITNLTLRRDAYTMNQMEIPQGAGSGIVWPSRDGQDGTIVVTNYHVVRGSNELMVKLNEGEESVAKIVGVDEDKDIAVLKLATPIEGLRPVTLAQSAEGLQVGQSAYAIGNPFGLDHTLTSGVISGLGREISSQATGRPITDVIQTDCSINPGNSGGPLLSSDGLVIGINTAIYSSTGMSGGVGFAINIDTVKNSVQQILTSGRVRKPLIGIQFAPDMSVEMLGIDGVLVISAKPGSPAERAGIRYVRVVSFLLLCSSFPRLSTSLYRYRLFSPMSMLTETRTLCQGNRARRVRPAHPWGHHHWRQNWIESDAHQTERRSVSAFKP